MIVSSILYPQEYVNVIVNSTSNQLVKKSIIQEETLAKAAFKNEIRAGKTKIGDQGEFYFK